MEASRDLELRFHASTPTVMSMELPDEVLLERIDRCIKVSDESKTQLVQEWSVRMGHALPLPACNGHRMGDSVYSTSVGVGV